MAKKKKAKLKNRIAIILDRSGSMATIRTETVDAFNEQVKAIKASSKDMDTKVSLVTFASEKDEPLIWNKATRNLKKLELKDYIPNGMTAMYDAVGFTINEFKQLKEFNDKNTSFLIVIISDGEENNSKAYRSADIAELVKELTATQKWTFTYLGANQDLSKVSQNLGLSLGNTMSFVASSAGVAAGSAINASATTTYLNTRSTGATYTSNFYTTTTAAIPADADKTTGSKK